MFALLKKRQGALINHLNVNGRTGAKPVNNSGKHAVSAGHVDQVSLAFFDRVIARWYISYNSPDFRRNPLSFFPLRNTWMGYRFLPIARIGKGDDAAIDIRLIPCEFF
jgi:hypothetical protein